ncbi:MAG: type II toxin-antitoxin system RelE/ParE family toxin [Candidatus Cloacimonetes bacterium]|nr:type II toxin-antitoxin system RelE/ParE family toxin [Candidatus Cloacimonadota bacterium]
MYKVVFHPSAEKEFLKFPQKDREFIASKITDLSKGIFKGDKPLKGKHKGKFRKRAGRTKVKLS